MKRIAMFLLAVSACAPAVRGPVLFTPARNSREWARQQKLSGLLRVSVPYSAPDIYTDWWAETLPLCECKPRVQFSDLQWRSVTGSGLYERGEYWDGIDVVFVLGTDMYTPGVVQHEMLHGMLGGDDGHNHRAWRKLKRNT